MPPLLTGRCGLAAAVLKGTLVATGGQTELRSVEVFDGTWRPTAAMGLGRQHHAAVASKGWPRARGGQSMAGYLVVLGGRSHGRASSSVEAWSIGAKTWQQLAPMRVQRPDL